MTALATTARRPRIGADTPGHLTERQDLTSKILALDWTNIASELEAHGCATTPVLLSPPE
jgi:hypothetical protein